MSRSSAYPIIQIHRNSCRNLFELKIRFTLSGLMSSFETADLILPIYAMDESIRTPASYETGVSIHVMGNLQLYHRPSHYLHPSTRTHFTGSMASCDDTSFLPFPATRPHPSRFPVNAPARLAATKYLDYSNCNGKNRCAMACSR